MPDAASSIDLGGPPTVPDAAPRADAHALLGGARPAHDRALPPSLLTLLYGHEPHLAWVMDPAWDLLASNHMLETLVGPVAPHLLVPPVNVLRLILHPQGMSPRLNNLAEVHGHLLRRLRRQVDLVGGEALLRLEREVSGYRSLPEATGTPANQIVMPVRLWVGVTLLNLISTAVFFGTPWERVPGGVTAQCVFPADEATRRYLFSGFAERPPPD